MKHIENKIKLITEEIQIVEKQENKETKFDERCESFNYEFVKSSEICF